MRNYEIKINRQKRRGVEREKIRGGRQKLGDSQINREKERERQSKIF